MFHHCSSAPRLVEADYANGKRSALALVYNRSVNRTFHDEVFFLPTAVGLLDLEDFLMLIKRKSPPVPEVAARFDLQLIEVLPVERIHGVGPTQVFVESGS